jgi:hypothetical protein
VSLLDGAQNKAFLPLMQEFRPVEETVDK